MANMFGALNRFISRLDAEPQPQQARHTTGHGFQVLRNTDNNIPLDPWFDFIIGINGRTIDNADPTLFATEVRNCAGSTISLGVFGAKGQHIREIYVPVPHPSQQQQDGHSAGASLLGLALQWCPLNLTDDVWHILDVMPNSPADVAGLLPYSDYVIGSPDGVLRGDSGLAALVDQFEDGPLRLYVYNHEYDVTRLVTITPSKHWGGDGALGCVLGYGALHRVPAPLNEPSQDPGETLFDSGNNEHLTHHHPVDPSRTSQPTSPSAQGADFLVPANMQFPDPSPLSTGGGGGPPLGRAKKARVNATAPVAGLDDYFKEGEQKSRELDGSRTPKPSGGLPPPPKAGGGPPKAASPAPPQS